MNSINSGESASHRNVYEIGCPAALDGGAIAGGGARLQLAEDGLVLVLDAGQILYRFERQ